MATLKLTQFSGEFPRVMPRLLPDTAAQMAQNVRLEDGGLVPFRQERLDHSVTGVSPIASIYKNGAEWLAFNTRVNAAPGPVATDRLYFTGNGVPQMRVAGVNYPLAMTAPTVALSVAQAGTGSGDTYSQLYVYTEVSTFGEESQPCPISASVNWQAGITNTLSGFRAPTGRVATQRIYRSQTGVNAGTDLYFIAERAASTANFVDTVPINGFAEVIPSKDWTPPSNTLSGLISIPNGMMVGFDGKDLYFCEPWMPHAWPIKYMQTMDYQIVALGAFGTTIVVMTTGMPYIVQGTTPDTMQAQKLELNLPCINAAGVVDLGFSVAYPTYDGLVVAGPNGVNVVTKSLFSRTDWMTLSPASFVSSQYSGKYLASYSYTDAAGVLQSGTLIIDLSGDEPFVIRESLCASAMTYDIPTSALYMLIGTNVYEFDALGQIMEVMTWKSKQFVMPTPVKFGCVYIEPSRPLTPAEQLAITNNIAAVKAQNATTFALPSIGGELNGAAINGYAVMGDALVPVPSGLSYVSVDVYGDGVLIGTVTQTGTPVRIPPATARMWEVRVSGNMPIAQVTLATTPREINDA